MNNSKVKIGIYKYENLINGKVYIGQSMNIYRRYGQHLYDTYNRPDKATGIDVAMAKYGINNFKFSIIEECSKEDLDTQEIYWIEYYNSYNNGYNRTKGGSVLREEDHPRAIMTAKEVWEIREMYNQHISRREVYNAYKDTGISLRGFLHIWNGEHWPSIHMDVYTNENKTWHKMNVGHSEDQIGLSSQNRAYSQKEIDQMYEDYKNGMNAYQLSKKYHRDCATIQKYMANPIATQKIKYRGRSIKNINTNKIFTSISSASKWANCGATTLTRHLATDGIAGVVPETNEPAKWIELA